MIARTRILLPFWWAAPVVQSLKPFVFPFNGEDVTVLSSVASGVDPSEVRFPSMTPYHDVTDLLGGLFARYRTGRGDHG